MPIGFPMIKATVRRKVISKMKIQSINQYYEENLF